MHKVLGGSGFAASYNYDTYSKAKCTSLKLTADKSNYWMPSEFSLSLASHDRGVEGREKNH